MQLELKFTLTFESDWHINAGFGTDSKADAVIERDPQGKPIISGTTLKGVFRDALYDLALNLRKDTREVTGILGAPGHDSRWQFSAAFPQEKGVRESVVATGVRVDPRYRRAEDNKYFKRELGAADVFTFSVIGTATDDESALREVEWLVAAASYIERLGGRRRRGNGKCTISLVEHNLHDEVLKSFENRHCGGTHQITDSWKKWIIPQQNFEFVPYDAPSSHRYRIILYTERPVIIAEKPEAGNVYQGQIIIPGSTLRGAFAEKAQPGDLQANDSTKYGMFKRLFILGGLRFSHLNPLEVSDGIGIPVAQLPMGLQQVATSQDNFTSVFQGLSEHKAFSGWVRLQDGFQRASYHTESHPHVRINPDLKRASDGDLYTYETIPAGRYYTGELYLADSSDWQNIGELLHVNIDKPFELRIGKGRNRSYGQVKVVIVPMAENDPPAWIHAPLEERLKAMPPNELFIMLATDAIVQDTWGRFYGRFEPDWLTPLLELENEADVEIIAADDERPAQVVRTKLVESFDARSGLPRWRDKALVAGSTARLVFANGKRPSTDVLKRMETEGIGLRRGEGFGRVIFNHPAHTGQWSGFAEAISIESLGVSGTKDNGNFTQKWKDIVQSALRENGLTSDPVNQAIARQLMEMRDSDPKTLIEKLTVQSSPNNKDSYKRYTATTKTVIALLQRVSDRPGYWQRALVLLAEALMNNREKA